MREEGFTAVDIKELKGKIKEKLDLKNTIKRSYQAVKLLQSKGYSKSWAISYLTAGDERLVADWLKLAEEAPMKMDEAA